MKSCGLYKVTNIKNGKFYIGSSTNIEIRWKNHKAALRNNHHINKHLQSAWNKYGEEVFLFEIIKKTKKLKKEEQKLLNEYVGSKDCYNKSMDATSPMRNRKHSESTLKTMSRQRRGTKKSEEWKRKIRESNIKTWSKLTTSSKFMSKHKKYSSFWKGKKFSRSHLQNMKSAGTNSWNKLSKNEQRERILKTSGENNPCAILTEQQVKNIRLDYATNQYTQKQLADKYKIKLHHVRDLVNRRTWKHI